MEFPEFERTRLIFSKSIGSKDTPFSTEIASLKAQLEEEKAKREKPDITGKTNEIYLEKLANGELCRSNPEYMYWNFHFIINVYLANHEAPTTIEQFKLVLRAGERSYNGEKESDAEWRAWGTGELIDIEKLNDVPLEHTRNGSLWFAVMGVQDTKDKSEIELELTSLIKMGFNIN
jgi:hypothetical protein